jgi:hypothetical protein
LQNSSAENTEKKQTKGIMEGWDIGMPENWNDGGTNFIAFTHHSMIPSFHYSVFP